MIKQATKITKHGIAICDLPTNDVLPLSLRASSEIIRYFAKSLCDFSANPREFFFAIHSLNTFTSKRIRFASVLRFSLTYFRVQKVKTEDNYLKMKS